jgi:hypothetical protein
LHVERPVSRATRSRRAGSLRLLLLVSLWAAPVDAGPPMLSDDPHTVGPGRVELIVATSGLGFGDSATLLAPVADLTLGVVTGVDITALVSPVFTFSQGMTTEATGGVTLGVKWQPIRGEHWNASFTPTGALNMPRIGTSTLLLPVQVEYARQAFAVGADGGYIVGFDDPDLWFAALYGTWAASDSLTLLAEIWGGQKTGTVASEAGLTFGLDWKTPKGMHLLTSLGPGLVWRGDRQVRWHFYVGLQWDFALWSKD